MSCPNTRIIITKKTIYNLTVLFLLFFFSNPLLSQINDAGLWTAFEARKRINKKFQLNYNQEFRFNENISELGTFYSEFGVGYRYSPKLRFSGFYRFANKRRVDDSYSTRHRFYVNVSYRERFKPLTITGRLRYQNQYKDIYSSEEGFVPQNYLRYKIDLSVDINKRIDASISSEIYTPFVDFAIHPIEKLRYSAGIDYKIDKNNTINAYYLIQHYYSKSIPLNLYIIGLAYQIRL